MTCKDCMYHGICRFTFDVDGALDIYEDSAKYTAESHCDDFKDKSKFIELPCKVGDIVYVPVDVGERFKEAGLPWKDYIGQIIPMPATIQHITILYNNKLYSLFESGNILQFKETDIGNKFFITQAAAEKALKERKNG